MVDTDRVLTCAHVVARSLAEGGALWVAFPHAWELVDRRIRVRDVVQPSATAEDVTVLRLEEHVPEELVVQLRCPSPGDLLGGRWWSFGFPQRLAWEGNASAGVVGAELGYGALRLDTESTFAVEPGYSGAGLWSPDYKAVVGMVGKASAGSKAATALSMSWIDRCLPEQKIRSLAERWRVQDAGEAALAAWGWSLQHDPEAGRHWRPRARGVSVDSERGFRFRGRETALRTVIDWISAAPTRRALLVTGSPGVGKSAVLGRVVTTADAGVVASLPPEDDAVRAGIGSIACAIHAKGKTALEVATEIARAASAPLPEIVEDLAPELRSALSGGESRPFTIVIDALDEAATPTQSRTIVTQLVLPLVETCADVGVKVVVGSRRRDDDGDLLAAFGLSAELIDLDEARFFAQEDLQAYALATLQLVGDERPGNPYADPEVARAVAERIAALSDQNFLVAGLVARGHGLYDSQAVDPGEISFTPTVDATLASYLDRLPGISGVPARTVLAALAYAEAPGFTTGLWSTAVEALNGKRLNERELQSFAQSSVANFLIESSSDTHSRAFRLFHQALNDSLIATRERCGSRVADDRALAEAFRQAGQCQGWASASPYLLRSLAGHASRGHVLDALLGDATFLLHADLRRLIPLEHLAATDEGRRRARLLRMTPGAIDAGPADRAALFSITEAVEDLGKTYQRTRECTPYRARWAAADPDAAVATLIGHTAGVQVVCAVRKGRQHLLATAAENGTVRVWDPATAHEVFAFQTGSSDIATACAVPAGKDLLLAIAAGVGHSEVKVWDPSSGHMTAEVSQHTGEVRTMCSVQRGKNAVLVTATRGYEGEVRLWEFCSGSEIGALRGHAGGVSSLCAVQAEGMTLIATGGGYDGVVHLWDPENCVILHSLAGHKVGVSSICALWMDGRKLLATGGHDGVVCLWDIERMQLLVSWRAHAGEIRTLNPIRVKDRELLGSCGTNDRALRLWEPHTGRLETERIDPGWIRSLCALRVPQRDLCAIAADHSGDNRTVRLIDPGATEPKARSLSPGAVDAIVAFPGGNGDRVVTRGRDGIVRVWDLDTGAHIAHHPEKQDPGAVLLPVTVGNEHILAINYAAGLEFWKPEVGRVRFVGDARRHRFGMSLPNEKTACLLEGGSKSAIALSTERGVDVWDAHEPTSLRHAFHFRSRFLVAVKGHAGQRLMCSMDGRAGLREMRLCDPDEGVVLEKWNFPQQYSKFFGTVERAGRTWLTYSSGADGLHLWDPLTGEWEPWPTVDHTSEVTAVATVRTGGTEWLCTAGGHDRTVRVWDPARLCCVLTIPTAQPVWAVKQVGERLIIGTRSGVMALELDAVGLGQT
ncbi:trypsin-like peptidase domain-containing protein [Streptomyces sp. CA-135486]|uniref:trypsin-like peptidase domain-containing protein n=1 Tax=Streptomyces sp. CA-135486 TaxID=3240049 RepID=UPI003D91EA0F